MASKAVKQYNYYGCNYHIGELYKQFLLPNGIPKITFYHRILRGWTVERAVNEKLARPPFKVHWRTAERLKQARPNTYRKAGFYVITRQGERTVGRYDGEFWWLIGFSGRFKDHHLDAIDLDPLELSK